MKSKDSANSGRIPTSCPFTVTEFINEEATGCINEEATGVINEAAIGVIIAGKNAPSCLFHVLLFH